MCDSTSDYIELMQAAIKEDQKTPAERFLELILFLSEMGFEVHSRYGQLA